MTTVAVIPVRSLEGAKSRLGEVLDPEERRALVERLLRRTLAATTGAASIDETIVVSPIPRSSRSPPRPVRSPAPSARRV